MVSSELIGDLEGKGRTKGHVGDGEVNHEDNGGTLGRGTEDEEPHRKAISHQVNGSDDHVDDRNDDADVCVLKEEQRCVVQLGAAQISRHDWMGLGSNHLCGRVREACATYRCDAVS